MKDQEKLAHDAREIPKIAQVTRAVAPFVLEAEPQSLEIDLARTAVMVIDMQHTFVSKGGKFDLRGEDISKTQTIIEPIKRLTGAARGKGMRVIYIAHHYSPDFHDSGGPDSPNWYKSTITDYRERPERRDKLCFCGRWGAGIIDELKPETSDIFIAKPRYSAFFGTRMDMILKTYGIKYLICVGVATNICVEGTIRDAFNLDYFAILISDATMNSGPEFMQEAALRNVRSCFGWVTNMENIMRAIAAKETE